MPMQDSPVGPQPARSIDFHNPGTAAHVASEIEENYRELIDRREKMVARWDEEANGHQAAMSDINHRIDMATAALSSWEKAQPQVQADHYPQGMHQQMQTPR